MKLPRADCRYGAPMGRHNVITEPDHPVKFRLYQIKLDMGGYDNGGAYWGYGDKLYHAYGDGEHEQQEMFIRATDRIDAKKQVLKQFNNARFYC